MAGPPARWPSGLLAAVIETLNRGCSVSWLFIVVAPFNTSRAHTNGNAPLRLRGPNVQHPESALYGYDDSTATPAAEADRLKAGPPTGNNMRGLSAMQGGMLNLVIPDARKCLFVAATTQYSHHHASKTPCQSSNQSEPRRNSNASRG